MMMRHKTGDFDGPNTTMNDGPMARMEKAAKLNAIRIDNLSMASRPVVDRLTRISGEESMKPGWFCLRVMTGCEFAVEKILDKAGVTSLVVRTNEQRVVKRGRVQIIKPRPVIAGYVLVYCHPIAAAMMGLLNVRDVIDVVGGAISPWRANAESIARFNSFAREGKYDQRPVSGIVYLPEEVVRVCDGPFASFDAVVISIDGEKGRVGVEVNIFGRSTPVELAIAQIEKV